MIDKKHWHYPWSERDAQAIDHIAKNLRVRSGVDERTAWFAAEQQYAGRVAAGNTRVRLHEKPRRLEKDAPKSS